MGFLEVEQARLMTQKAAWLYDQRAAPTRQAAARGDVPEAT